MATWTLKIRFNQGIKNIYLGFSPKESPKPSTWTKATGSTTISVSESQLKLFNWYYYAEPLEHYKLTEGLPSSPATAKLIRFIKPLTPHQSYTVTVSPTAERDGDKYYYKFSDGNRGIEAIRIKEITPLPALEFDNYPDLSQILKLPASQLKWYAVLKEGWTVSDPSDPNATPTSEATAKTMVGGMSYDVPTIVEISDIKPKTGKMTFESQGFYSVTQIDKFGDDVKAEYFLMIKEILEEKLR